MSSVMVVSVVERRDVWAARVEMCVWVWEAVVEREVDGCCFGRVLFR